MNFLKNVMSTEPALLLGLIEAALTLGLVFGLKLDVAQIGAILAFVNVLIAVLTRQMVVPVEKYTDDVKTALYTKPPMNPNLVTDDAGASV